MTNDERISKEPMSQAGIEGPDALREAVVRLQAQNYELRRQLTDCYDRVNHAYEEAEDWQQRFIDLAISLGKSFPEKE